MKQLKVVHAEGPTDLESETIEQGLRELADKVESGEVKPPFDLEFEGPGGLEFTVSVKATEDVHELARQGFMF
jgi:hypothetical protein